LGERGKTPPKKAGSGLGNFLPFFSVAQTKEKINVKKDGYTMMRSHHFFRLAYILLTF
jgi:hypothetical protein